jgi:type II secretory pathway component GspD/PulD (secretin)
MIQKLRQSMGLGQQVSIEARFLLVSESFLEDIGVDVDFTSIHLGGKWDPLQVQQQSSTMVSGGPSANALTARTAYGGVLDDLQVQFLIRATEQSSNSRSLLAPRVTVLSGERANLRVETQESYVSQVTADQSAASSGNNTSTIFATVNTTISQFTSGVELQVTPTVSSDKKYVILLIDTRTVSPPVFKDYSSTVIAGQPPFTIQMPEATSTTIQTRVTMPDKGTLLMGGQKLTTEDDAEAGVPILGKIPVIGRLFSNRSQDRQQKVLLILVTPTIILNEEREREAFPDLNAAKM